MARTQPESILVGKIITALRLTPGCEVTKIHGGPYTRKGEPDLLGCCNGRFFAIEVKLPGETPEPIQLHVLRLWAKAGARVGIARSVQDALDIAIYPNLSAPIIPPGFKEIFPDGD